MMYPAAKVYHDGSHYVAIPYHPAKPRKPKKMADNLLDIIGEKEKEEFEDKEKEVAKEAYEDSSELKGEKRKEKAVEKLMEQCMSEQRARELVEKEVEHRKRQISDKKRKFMRKAFMNEFNYFVTFTYDDEKHTEASFKRGLINKLCKYKKKYGWKYMGVWEISPNERLHFHGMLYIPEGKMVGELKTRRDYSTKQHKMQETTYNTFFEDHFGRNDFREIIQHKQAYEMAISYIMKYISKTNEKVIHSKGLPMFLISDINSDDELGRIGKYERSVVLPDDFECWDEGEFLGNMSKEVKPLLKTKGS
ncbi:MAG: hypothetical protein K5923_01775 [Clostridia bacterium]|nr:hypothetical protein [Clostridia bacterium]